MLTAFARDEELPFLFYKESERSADDPLHGQPLLTLAVGPGVPSTLTFDELWGEPIGVLPLEHVQPIDKIVQLQFSFLANIIAKETRRGPGNIAYVGSQDWLEILSNHPYPIDEVTYLPHLKHNELRVTYFNKRGAFKAVDGGVALLPSGLQAVPTGHAKYFARSFL